MSAATQVPSAVPAVSVGSQRRSDAVRLLRLTRRHLPPLAASLVFRVIALFGSVAVLVVALRAVVLAVTGDLDVGRTLLTIAALALAKGVARYLEQLTGHTVAFGSLATLRVFFFRALEPQAPAATEGRRTGDLLSRVTRDIDRVEVFFAHTLVPAVAAVVVPVVVLVWIAGRHPVLAAVTALGWLLAGLLVPWIGARRSGGVASRFRRARGDLVQHVSDDVQGVREILVLDAADSRRAALEDRDAASAGLQRSAGRTVALRRGLNAALVPATLLAVAAVGTALVGRGELDLVGLATVLAAVLGTTPAVLAVEEFQADLDQAFASARRVFEVADGVPATSDPVEPLPLPARGPHGRSLTFEGVTFTYPGAPHEAVSDVTFDVPAGSTTALVGVSGSGKSTLAHLALRFHDPAAGAVRLDGVDVRDLALDTLRTEVAFVPQRPYLTAGTLAESLRLGAPNASDAELRRACEVAQLVDLVARIGLDARMGEMGSTLSGGERQRVAVARALVAGAAVIVLDESTSHLDTATQEGLLAALRADGRTLVQIVHRLEALREDDHVVVLDLGRVVEQGTCRELRARDGVLAGLLARA